MNWTVGHILDLIALIFAVLSVAPPLATYPLLAVAVILLSIAGLVG